MMEWMKFVCRRIAERVVSGSWDDAAEGDDEFLNREKRERRENF